MRLLQPGQHIAGHPYRLTREKWTGPAKLRHCRALDELRRHHQVPVKFRRVVERDDVWMRQTGVDLHLAQQPLQGFRVAVRGARQRPQDFKLARGQVADLIRNSCFGSIDDTKKLIVANDLTGFGHCLGTQSSAILGSLARIVNHPLLERTGLNQSYQAELRYAVKCHCTSTTKWAKPFLPPASSALMVKKCVPVGSPVSTALPPWMAQFAEAGTQDTVGVGPSASAAVKGTMAVPSPETRLDEPGMLNVGVRLPSKSASSASRLARYWVSTRNGTWKR